MRVVFASVLACGLVLGVACVDTTPISVAVLRAEIPERDAGGDAPAKQSCQGCIESPSVPGPGCGDALGKCLADDKCKATYTCMVKQGCLEQPDQRAIVLCGLPCAEAAGIVSQEEPSALLIIRVANCAQLVCVAECKITTDAAAD